LETARGGILRRGLALQHAEVAAVVTLSADHFGDYGIMDLQSLAAVKLVTTHAVRTRGTLVINADVPELANAVSAYSGQLARVSINDAADDSSLAEIPATLAGTATHNVLNALVARQIAAALHLGPAANDTLMRFGADPRDNVGRLMRRDLHDVSVVVDYAHNPQSVRALIEGTRSIQAKRRAIILGTGGDRDDIALHDIATAAFNSGIIDLYIAKEMPRFLRGRPPGTLSAAIITTLRELGVEESQIVSAPDDIAAVRHALRWAQPGDLLLLGVHDKRDTILTLLDSMHTLDWRAGDMVPEIAQV
jgi:cyanophycin synthetase